jgi:peptidase E
MSKLLLTSAGFTNTKIAQAFRVILHKPLSEAKIALISVGVNSPESHERQELKIQELKEVGFGFVTPFDALHPLPPDTLDPFDALYMRGGNTFSILKAIRETGFDHQIVSFILRGGAYVGSSAGSIILGPDIAVAGEMGPYGDPNNEELTKTKGLNFVPFAIVPHFIPEVQPFIDAFSKTVSYPILPLTDAQAMLCVDGNCVRIGS